MKHSRAKCCGMCLLAGVRSKISLGGTGKTGWREKPAYSSGQQGLKLPHNRRTRPETTTCQNDEFHRRGRGKIRIRERSRVLPSQSQSPLQSQLFHTFYTKCSAVFSHTISSSLWVSRGRASAADSGLGLSDLRRSLGYKRTSYGPPRVSGWDDTSHKAVRSKGQHWLNNSNT